MVVVHVLWRNEVSVSLMLFAERETWLVGGRPLGLYSYRNCTVEREQMVQLDRGREVHFIFHYS